MDETMKDPLSSGSLSSVDDASQSEVRDDPTCVDQTEYALTHRPRGLATLNSASVDSAIRKGTLKNAATPHSPNAAAGTRVNTPDRPSRSAPQDLNPFADQLVAIAAQLRAGNWESRAPANERTAPAYQTSPEAAAEAGRDDQRNTYAEMARLSYAKRRKRSNVFGDTELFGEPAWDILLDLYIAQAEDKPVSVSSACIGSAAPPTTGLRWLGVLAEQGFVERKHDPQDQRRVLVRLTDKALEAMDAYFECSAALQNDRRAVRN